MKIIIPGGSGQVGTVLARYFHTRGHEVVVLSRVPRAVRNQPAPWRVVQWDGAMPGPWTAEIGGADAVIHLSGRSVNCRYTPQNRRDIFNSRTVPTTLLGEVITQVANPPRIWMNASTSTFYRHALDRPQDEFTGELGDLPSQRGTHESVDLPETWSFSIDVATRWEQAFRAANTPRTHKITLRSSMVMSPDPGGVFSVLSGLVRAGLGGAMGPGTQYVSWIHEEDYCRAVEFLLAQPEIVEETGGVVNLTSPNPLPNREFMRALRRAWHVAFGLPATTWMLEIGAVFLRTETELILKSRQVVPGVLQKHGFGFQFPDWPAAAQDLVVRSKEDS